MKELLNITTNHYSCNLRELLEGIQTVFAERVAVPLPWEYDTVLSASKQTANNIEM